MDYSRKESPLGLMLISFLDIYGLVKRCTQGYCYIHSLTMGVKELFLRQHKERGCGILSDV